VRFRFSFGALQLAEKRLHQDIIFSALSNLEKDSHGLFSITVGSARTTALVSGMRFGTWNCGVGHEDGYCLTQDGPSHHSLQLVRLLADTPLLSISVGFSVVGFSTALWGSSCVFD